MSLGVLLFSFNISIFASLEIRLPQPLGLTKLEVTEYMIAQWGRMIKKKCTQYLKRLANLKN